MSGGFGHGALPLTDCGSMPWRKNTLQPFALGNNSEPAHSVHGSQSSVVGVDSDVNVGDLDLEGLNHFL